MDNHMSLEKVIFIGFGFILGMLAILQIYLAYRIKKSASLDVPEHRMGAKESFRLGLFHMLFYSCMIGHCT